MTQIQTIRELVALWPSAEVFSDDLGLKYRSHGRLMKLRGSIPRRHWDALVLAASHRGYKGVDHTLLTAIHARRPARAKARAA